jgi:hypothetical protein
MQVNAMQKMFETVLRGMGINPEGLMEGAKGLFDRFIALEKRVSGVTDERMIELEAEIIRIKEHLGLGTPEPIHAEPAAQPVAQLTDHSEPVG